MRKLPASSSQGSALRSDRCAARTQRAALTNLPLRLLCCFQLRENGRKIWASCVHHPGSAPDPALRILPAPPCEVAPKEAAAALALSVDPPAIIVGRGVLGVHLASSMEIPFRNSVLPLLRMLEFAGRLFASALHIRSYWVEACEVVEPPDIKRSRWLAA